MGEWKRVKLGDLLEEYCERNTNNEYIPVAVGKYGIRKREDIYTKELSKDTSKNKVIMKDTLTIGMGSNQIDIGILVDDKKYCVSPAYTTFKIKYCNSKFLEYYLECINPKLSELFMIVSARQGKSVDKEGLLKFEIMIPTRKEQEKIVKILKNIDSIINKYSKLLEEKSQFIKSQFVEMLRTKEYKMIELDECIESILKGPFGSDMKKSLYVPKDNNTYKVYIQINVIEKNENLGDYWISKEYFDNKMNRYEVFPGDFIITCDGTLGKIFQLNEKIEKGVISSSLMKITLNKEMIDSSYFEFLWNNYLLNKLLKKVGNTALKHLPSAKVIQKSIIPYLNMEEQKSYAKFIRLINKQKILLEQQKKNYEKLKKGLMQKLLTGKVRVKI